MPISFLIPPKQKQFKASWHQVYTLASSNVSTSFPSLCLSHPPLPLSLALHNPVPLKLHPLTLELVPAEPSSPCPFPCLTKISHPFPCLAFNSILTAVGRRESKPGPRVLMTQFLPQMYQKAIQEHVYKLFSVNFSFARLIGPVGEQVSEKT